MNVDTVLAAFHTARVDCLLIGGMNFLLRHQPVLTFDIDIWIKDDGDNRRRCEQALAALEAEWGPDDRSWGPVERLAPGWLDRGPVFCLTSPHGAIDIFRNVEGLDDWAAARARADTMRTAAGTEYVSLSDRDMLACQLALPQEARKLDRTRYLRRALGESHE